MRRGSWKTRLGIYLAAIGAAFGLGCLWRFPYVVADNGGGAFVVLYFFMIILLGVPLLIGELLIGKVTRRSVVSAQKQLVAQSMAQVEKNAWTLRLLSPMGILCVVVCLFILSYFSVISGWVLYFLFQFLTLPFVTDSELVVGNILQRLHGSGGLQIFLTAIHIVAILIIVAKEVDEGIEKWIGFIIPIFVGILAVLITQSTWTDSNYDVWRYFFYPDLTKLNLNSLGAAIGHVCFTLSIGFGTMVTFGSYLRDDASVPATGFRVAIIDGLTAIIAGILIFPLVGEVLRAKAGPELLFQTVPGYLLNFQGGVIYGIFFFICLYLAALGASISLLETVVANVTEGFRWRRGPAALMAGALALVLSIPAALSSSYFADFRLAGRGLLQSIDHILIDWVVPLLALFFCFVVVRRVSDKWKSDEFQMGEDSQSGEVIYLHWRFLMKWVVPFVILLGITLQIFGLLY